MQIRTSKFFVVSATRGLDFGPCAAETMTRLRGKRYIMNKWVMAAIMLAAAALMYVSIIYKMS